MTGRGLLTWAAVVGAAALLLGCGRPARARTPVSEGRPCTHGQFTGVLARWTAAPDGGLTGDVDLTNVSTVDCTIRGGTPGETAIPAGTHARLRLRWSPPCCG